MRGSLINNLSGTPAGLKPEVGMGATKLCYTDREPFTVIRVSPSGKTVWVQHDNATRTDSNGMSEIQNYTYEPNPNGAIVALKLTKRGWAHKGERFALGYRNKYHDYSF